MRLRILVGCERSGKVRRAFARRGWDAISVDTLPAKDAPRISGEDGTHIVADLLAYMKVHTDFHLFVVHPECRYLSVSGMHWTTRGLRDPRLTEEALSFAKQCLDAPYEFRVLENPVSIISSRLEKASQYIQPHQFGHDASKKTGLWLRNLPLLRPTKLVPPRMIAGRPRWANQTDSGQNRLGPSETRAQERAETYAGVADAFAKQYGAYIEKIVKGRG